MIINNGDSNNNEGNQYGDSHIFDFTGCTIRERRPPMKLMRKSPTLPILVNQQKGETIILGVNSVR